ncbi:MAG: VIT family protein [Actinomycetaceae bacterium]|nr:VIT family protein [Arcanobacterium sp.]MDD7505383.1 VIT family protein [Actinomycetaceae bacterium]MDY6142935.1 VIT family protein [Arcanobacterium sp.]
MDETQRTPLPETTAATTFDSTACDECSAISAEGNESGYSAESDSSPDSNLGSKLNWLRAGVLGANDGIVSTAGLVVGVSGASMTYTALFISGIAGLVAGALSMAAGEYVSVSTQRDAEEAAIAAQKQEIAHDPQAAQRALGQTLRNQGLSKPLATRVASELSTKDALKAHVHFELNMDPDELTSPLHAAIASMISFALGALIPLFAIVISPQNIAVPITAVAVTIALAITGSVSAKLGGARILRATVRNILWGNIAMFVTYYIGTFVGGSIG